jgi:hypothetical protein
MCVCVNDNHDAISTMMPIIVDINTHVFYTCRPTTVFEDFPISSSAYCFDSIFVCSKCFSASYSTNNLPWMSD